MTQLLNMTTEHETNVQVFDDMHSTHVETTLFDGDSQYPQFEGTVYLSLTPAEARKFADALLNASQNMEDRMPHGNS